MEANKKAGCDVNNNAELQPTRKAQPDPKTSQFSENWEHSQTSHGVQDAVSIHFHVHVIRCLVPYMRSTPQIRIFSQDDYIGIISLRADWLVPEILA